MIGGADAPVGTGDTRSWFYHYKVGIGGEVFVPVFSGEADEMGETNLLWFVMDGVVIGYVPLRRQVMDNFNGRLELWFNSDEYTDIADFDEEFPAYLLLMKHQDLQDWFGILHKRICERQ